jgi:hypothetical protein
MYIVVSYLVYLTISLGVTVWVAKTLQKNGRVFLMDAFHDNAELADSVNSLLVVGFYLINVGYVTLAMRTASTLDGARQAIELICDKIGVVLLVLGIMHFFNLYLFNRLRKRGRDGERPVRTVRPERPPLPPLPEPWAPAGTPVGKVLD